MARSLLGDGTGNTARTVSAFLLAGAETVWGISTTEGFDDNTSLAAVDLPPDSTNALLMQVDQPPVPIGGADTPALDPERNLAFQVRTAIGLRDRLTVSVVGEPVAEWAGANGWGSACVPLTSCPGFPCEVSFAVSIGPETQLQPDRAV